MAILNTTEGDYLPPRAGFIFITDYEHVVLQSVVAGVEGQQGTGVWCHQALFTAPALL